MESERAVHVLRNVVAFDAVKPNGFLPAFFCRLDSVVHELFGEAPSAEFGEHPERVQDRDLVACGVDGPVNLVVRGVALMVHDVGSGDGPVLNADELFVPLDGMYNHAPRRKASLVPFGEEIFFS